MLEESLKRLKRCVLQVVLSERFTLWYKVLTFADSTDNSVKHLHLSPCHI